MIVCSDDAVGELPAEWMDWVTDHELVCSGDKGKDGLANMLEFPLSRTTPTPELLKRFLIDAFHAFCAKAARSQVSCWFYAWHDELAGQLRCSACRVETATDLPFGCKLDIVDVPDPVAVAAATSPYSDGIPWSEFRHVDVSDLDDYEDPIDFTLTVFAKPLWVVIKGTGDNRVRP